MSNIARTAAAVALFPFLTGMLHAADFDLRLIGTHQIVTGTELPGMTGDGFGGISGIDRAANGSYFAISDDGGKDKAAPRFYNVSIDYSLTGFGATPITVNSTQTMKQPDGMPYPAVVNPATVDPEGIRVAPNGNLYWVSEGIYNSTTPASSIQPFVREMTTAGAHVRSYNMPTMFNYDTVNAAATTGSRSNLVFEGLTTISSGNLFVITEGALVQDGGKATKTTGAPVRITEYNTTGDAVRQFAYQIDPVTGAPGSPESNFRVNGATEILSIDDTSFIVLERSFEVGYGNTIKIVRISLEGATDILGVDALMGASYDSVTRDVLYTLEQGPDMSLPDNIEGITWGHVLENGNKSLLLVSDNNFGGAPSNTVLMAFEVTPVPEPSAWGAALATGAGIAAVIRRRRRA